MVNDSELFELYFLKNELFSKKLVAWLSDSQMPSKAYVPKLGFELKPFSAPEPSSL
jgi:hypothetical protein